MQPLAIRLRQTSSDACRPWFTNPAEPGAGKSRRPTGSDPACNHGLPTEIAANTLAFWNRCRNDDNGHPANASHSDGAKERSQQSLQIVGFEGR
jgi:hypothetical protein